MEDQPEPVRPDENLFEVEDVQAQGPDNEDEEDPAQAEPDSVKASATANLDELFDSGDEQDDLPVRSFCISLPLQVGVGPEFCMPLQTREDGGFIDDSGAPLFAEQLAAARKCRIQLPVPRIPHRRRSAREPV